MLIAIASKLLAPLVSMPLPDITAMLELPAKPELGDVAFPCFVLSKTMRKAPPLIAAELADALNGMGEGVRAETAGGYLNLFFDPALWAGRIVNAAMAEGYGSSDAGAGRHVVIDMSSPNIAKPFGMGHLRSTMIGHALVNLYRMSGYRVTSVNHLGDWGTQFGKLIAAYDHWGERSKLEAEPIKESLRLYVRFHVEAETAPELEDEARDWFRKLESGDTETQHLWRFFVEESLKEFHRVYDRLGVEFDLLLGESFYNDKIGAVVARLSASGLLEESDGAQVVRLDEQQMPPCLILKSDGTTIYPTRDLATAFYRKQELKADQMLYVVGAEQTLHFQQVFAVLGKMGEEWQENCRHVPFGLMKYEGKKMSTRKGKVVFLDEVLDEAVAKALGVIEAKNPSLPDKEAVAEAIGVGAIVFGDLKNRRLLSVDFHLEHALSFDGETGPYLQYTYARILSLLRKGSFETLKARGFAILGEHLASPAAWGCLKTVSQFEAAIRHAVSENEPSMLARYLLDLTKDFNRFYNEGKIITDRDADTFSKLALSDAVAKVLKQGLLLLGIKTPAQI